jgi:hypothetical protein
MCKRFAFQNFSFADIPKVFSSFKIVTRLHTELPLRMDQKHLFERTAEIVGKIPLSLFSAPGSAKEFVGKVQDTFHLKSCVAFGLLFPLPLHT